MTRVHFAAACAATLLLAGVIVATDPAPDRCRAALLGCGCAMANGLAAAGVNRMAVGKDIRTFLWLTGLGHGLRVTALVLVLAWVLIGRMPQAVLFAAATLLGYFCFSAAEIAGLRRQAGGAGPSRPDA